MDRYNAAVFRIVSLLPFSRRPEMTALRALPLSPPWRRNAPSACATGCLAFARGPEAFQAAYAGTRSDHGRRTFESIGKPLAGGTISWSPARPIGPARAAAPPIQLKTALAAVSGARGRVRHRRRGDLCARSSIRLPPLITEISATSRRRVFPGVRPFTMARGLARTARSRGAVGFSYDFVAYDLRA